MRVSSTSPLPRSGQLLIEEERKALWRGVYRPVPMRVSSTSPLPRSGQLLIEEERKAFIKDAMSSHEGVPPLRGQGGISNAELADRLVEIGRSVGDFASTLVGETGLREACDALINDVSEFLSVGEELSSAGSASLIEPMKALFQQCLGYQSSPDAVALALRALDTVFLLCKKYDFAPDVQWMLDAIALLLREDTDPVLAASVLEHFGECVQFLPLGNWAEVIEPMKALFQQCLGYQSSPDVAVLALRALDTVFLLCKKYDFAPDVQWMLNAIQALPNIVGADPVLAASVLEHFGECVQFLPPDTPDALEGVIGPMGALFQRCQEEGSSPGAVALALRALDTVFLLCKKYDFAPDVQWMLDAIALLLCEGTDPVLAASVLEHFGECVQFLPPDTPDASLAGVIEPMGALFRRYSEDWSSPDAVALALRALGAALLLLGRTGQRTPQFILDALNEVAQSKLEKLDFENKVTLIHMLVKFSEVIQIWKLSDEARGVFAELAIDLMIDDDNLVDLVLKAEAFRVLCAFAKTGQPDSAGHVLGALQGAIEEMADMWTSYALATMLGDFAECVPSLPPDALAGVIKPVVKLFSRALVPLNTDIVTAAFRVLCAFARREPTLAEHVFDVLRGAMDMAAGNRRVRPALATMLRDFAELVPSLPRDLVGQLIEPVKWLFNEALKWRNHDIALVTAPFRVLCAFARREDVQNSAGPVLGALHRARGMAAGNRRVRPALATMLGDFAELVPFLLPEEEDLAGVIELVKGLFNEAFERGDPDIVSAAFHVLCAFVQNFSQREKLNIAMEVFSQALGMLKGQAGELGGKLAAINDRPRGGEAKLEAYDEAMQLFEGCASTLAGCIGQVPAKLRGSFIEQIKGEFNVAYGQMQADGNEWERFVGMKVAHELLKLWGLLLLPPGSIDVVLDAVVTALHQNGRHYFSCRGDAEWRRIHTGKPEVYGILARTDLALVTGKAVQLAERTANTVRALNTALGRSIDTGGTRTCDSYTEIFCCALGEMRGVTVRVIGEMQQKLRMTGGRDNLMGRIEEYIRLAEAKLREEGLGAGAQVFGIGYQGYGKRGTLERRGNAATLAIGAPIALEGKPLTPEELLALVKRFRAAIRGRLAPAEPPMATRSDRMGRPRIDDAAIDVITVIGTSHILTPAIIENLGLHTDARALCNFLQITKDSMRARLNENDKQASLMLGEGVVKSPEVTGDGKFKGASMAFTGGVVRINEGLLIENCQLSGKARLAERKNCQLKNRNCRLENRNCRLENRLATAEEQRDAADARAAKEKKARLAEREACLAADAQLAKERKARRAATARLAKEKARAARRGERFEKLAALSKEDKEIEKQLNRLDLSDAESAQLTEIRAQIQRRIGELEQEAQGSPPPSSPFALQPKPGTPPRSSKSRPQPPGTPPASSKSRPQPGTPRTPPKRPRPGWGARATGARPPATSLAGVGEENPELPKLLNDLDLQGFTGPTGVPVNVGALGNFQIYHVPNDGNCLFTAIGHFLGITQIGVRRQIHNFVRDVENRGRKNPNSTFLTNALEGIARTTDPAAIREVRWGGEDEARMAAIAFGRRVFVVNRFQGEETEVPRIEGYEAGTGNPIDMANVNLQIYPGQGQGDDIVLYAILDPSLEPGPGGRHWEALV